MKKNKKIIALSLATAMALTPATVFAANTTTGGAVSDGNMEGVINKEVWAVTVPTIADNGFDFLVDPQNLISQTAGARYSAATVVTDGAAGVYFKKAGNVYACSSDAIKVTNDSSFPVDISLTATMKLTSGAAVTIVNDSSATAVATGSALNLRMGLKDVTSQAVTYLAGTPSKSEAVVATSLAAVDSDNFEVVYENGAYKYKAKAGVASGASVGFVFVGECNTKEEADWSSAKDMTGKLEVVWKIAKAGAVADAYAYYYDADGCTYLALSQFDSSGVASNPGFTTANAITNFKLNGNDCGFSVDGGYVMVTPAQSSAATSNNDSWTFTFTFNGKNYKAVI